MRVKLLFAVFALPLTVLALEPDRALRPAEVVRYQLHSLQNNSVDDEGIASTFKFASPANKAVTGPLSRFRQLFEHPHYAPMLNHQHASIKLLGNSGEKSVFMVELIDGDGAIHHYRFELSRQKSGNCLQCWMTDAVMWSPRPGRSA